MEPREDLAGWGPAKRVFFRFTFAYFALYVFPFPLNLAGGALTSWYDELWHAVVVWVGRHLFQLEITVFPGGSGDTTYNYLQVLCFLVLAGAATLVWTLVDRKRPHYGRLEEGLRVYVRFWLAATMIMYGAFKVIPSQFAYPRLDRLVQPVGDMSPMGLLWTFMGASPAYTVFSGLAELLGGLLLIPRRTVLLGSLVSIAVMANVVMLNFAYDVPVKLFSSHLLAGALFLAAPHLRRLADFFLFNRPVAPVEIRPLFQRRWMHRGAFALRTVFAVGITGMALFISYQGSTSYGNRSPRPPIYGIWEVEELAVDGEVRPARIEDADRWRRVVVGHAYGLGVQLMDDSRRRYRMALDSEKKTIELTDRDDEAWKATLTYQEPEPGLLALQGELGGRPFQARLRRTDREFLLVERGFHWINETPYNR